MDGNRLTLIVDRRDPASPAGAEPGGVDLAGSTPVRIALPAAAEARYRESHYPAYTPILGQDRVPAAAKAAFVALGHLPLRGVPLWRHLLVEGVSLWPFFVLPLYVPLRDAIEVVEVCHHLLDAHHPDRVVLRGAGCASDRAWRYALGTVAEAGGIPFVDATPGAPPPAADRGGGAPGRRAPGPVSWRVRVPRETAGGEWLMRRIGRWLSRLARAVRPGPAASAPLVIVSWSRHWARLFDPRAMCERWGDEQFDAIVRASATTRPVLGLDVYGGYRRRGSSLVQILRRDVPDGLRTLLHRLFLDRTIRWQTFDAYTAPASAARARTVRGRLATLTSELLASPALAAGLTHRGVSLVPMLRAVLEATIPAYGAECVLAMDTAREFIRRTRPAAILVTNALKDHPVILALIAEGARAGVPTVGLQDGAYSEWGFGFPLRASPDVFQDPESLMIPTTTCAWGRATQEVLTRHGGYPPETIAVTGNWRYDTFLGAAAGGAGAALRARLGLSGTATVVVLAVPDLAEAPDLARRVVRALRARSDIQVVLKPHPGADPDIYAQILREEGSGRERLITGKLSALLLACDVVVTEASTVGLEAALLGKPVLETAFTTQMRRGYVESAIALGVRAIEDLPASLDRLSDPQVAARLAEGRRAFVEEQLYAADGRAAARVIAVVEDLVRRGRRP